jgi:adenosylhomocysteine nucleosidase
MVHGGLADHGWGAGCLMRLLLVAAEAMEFRGIRFAERPRKLPIPVHWARLGKVGGHEVLLVANGVGQKRASSAVAEGCHAFQAERVVSFGFCGALDPRLPAAAVVVGTGVAASGRCFAALPVTGKAPFTEGIVCSIDHVARTAEEKRRLHAEGGAVVEMEAGGVAECAEALGLPFSCMRAVTDLAGEDMANDFNRALRSDGHFDTMRIFGDALRHPATRVPELIRLLRRSSRAARALGDFFADCRF